MNVLLASLVTLPACHTTAALAQLASPGEPALPPGAKVLFELKDERPDHFGWGVVGLGDVDEDRVLDFYVGARCGVFALTQGRGYGDVFSGKTGKLLYRVEGEEDPEGDCFGPSACRVRDVDGDGADELAVKGEPQSQWKSYVKIFAGRDGRLLRRWEDATIGCDLGDPAGDGRRAWALNSWGKARIVGIRGDEVRAQFLGVVVALTCDVDGDGARDVLTLDDERKASAALRSARDGSVLRRLPDRSEGLPRYMAASAGDADGDGFTDVVFALYDGPRSTWTFPAQERRFRLMLVSGKDGEVLRDRWEEFEGPSALHQVQEVGDLDGDGCSDLFVARYASTGAPPSRARIQSGRDGRLIAEMTSNDWSFGVSAGNVGDLDGDGVPELVVGQHEYKDCQGRAWVISLGRAVQRATTR
jgi:hypothetical protein